MAVSDVLEDLREQLPSLKTAAELAPPEREIVEPAPNVPRSEEPPSFAERLASQRDAMQPVPEGFHSVASYPSAGIRVNKSSDRSIAAIQFAEGKLPTRAEKDILEALGQPEDRKFAYRPATRQWERQASESHGANIIEGTRIAADMARERDGRGR